MEDSELRLMQEIFSQSPNIEKAVLYGSRAKGTNKPFSDVDITLVGEKLGTHSPLTVEIKNNQLTLIERDGDVRGPMSRK